jgi:hypothetical protein
MDHPSIGQQTVHPRDDILTPALAFGAFSGKARSLNNVSCTEMMSILGQKLGNRNMHWA